MVHSDNAVRKEKGFWIGPDRPLERYFTMFELDDIKDNLNEEIRKIPPTKPARFHVAMIIVGQTHPRPAVIYYARYKDYRMMAWCRARLAKVIEQRWREVHYKSKQGNWIHAAIWF